MTILLSTIRNFPRNDCYRHFRNTLSQDLWYQIERKKRKVASLGGMVWGGWCEPGAPNVKELFLSTSQLKISWLSIAPIIYQIQLVYIKSLLNSG